MTAIQQAEMMMLLRYLRDHYVSRHWMGDQFETYPLSGNGPDGQGTWRELFTKLMDEVDK